MKRGVILAAVALAGLSAACAQPEPYAPELEVCVQDAAGAEAFKDLLKSYARTQGLKFVDSSRETAASGPSRPIIEVVAENDVARVVAGNSGLAFYQLAVGFTGPKASREALSGEVTALLEKRWKVERIQAGRGPVIDPECGRYANWKD